MTERNNQNSIEHNYENRYTDRFLKYLTKVMDEGKIRDRSLSASLHKANNYITRIRNHRIRLTFPIMCEIAEALEQLFGFKNLRSFQYCRSVPLPAYRKGRDNCPQDKSLC